VVLTETHGDCKRVLERERERERQPDLFHRMNIFKMYDFVCEKCYT